MFYTIRESIGHVFCVFASALGEGHLCYWCMFVYAMGCQDRVNIAWYNEYENASHAGDSWWNEHVFLYIHYIEVHVTNNIV